MLELINISKKSGKEYILKDISFSLEAGKILGIISLNPVETTTILKIILGNIEATQGYLKIDNKIKLGYSLKNYLSKTISASFGIDNIIDNMTIIDNTFLGNMKKVSTAGFFSKNKAITIAKDLFHEFKLPTAWDKKVESLSLEEKGALSIVRILLFDTENYLMDRVSENLTIPCYEKMKVKCIELKTKNKSVLFAASNVDQLFEFCDEVIVIRNGEIAFHSLITKTNAEEIYNIMNNTQYTINQAITTNYNDFQKNLKNIDELASKTLGIVENFCNIKNIFTCYIDQKNKINTKFSKEFIEEKMDIIIQQAESFFNKFKTNSSTYMKIKTKADEFYIFKIEYKNNLYAVLGFLNKIEKNIATLLKIINEFSYTFYYINQEILKNSEIKKREHEIVEIKKEMDIAKKIQTALIPPNTDSKIYEVSAKMLPADEVGGDYYDFLEVNENKVWLGIGDVTGHGLTSGLIMMMAQTAFNTVLLSNSNITAGELIVQVNKVLYNNIRKRMQENHFMTITFLVADDKGSVCYAGAHLDILIYRSKTNFIEKIGTSGMWMGIFPDISDKISENKFSLEKDDIMLLYTDGIIEAMNKDNKQFGPIRLGDILIKYSKESLDKIRDIIIQDVIDFAKVLKDDVTLVLVKRK